MYSAWARCIWMACSSWRSCMPRPRTIRYTRMPSHGTKITNSTQRVLATPPRSLLRKMSPKIQNRHMNQAKNKKISKSASRKDPLSLNINQPFGKAKTATPSGAHAEPVCLPHHGIRRSGGNRWALYVVADNYAMTYTDGRTSCDAVPFKPTFLFDGLPDPGNSVAHPAPVYPRAGCRNSMPLRV